MKYRYRVLAFLFVLSMITYIDRVSIGTLGSRMRQDLGIGLDAWGWIIGAFALAYPLFEIPSGAMGDRWGSRATLSRIVLWWSVFTCATGAANSFTTLIICRFLFGAGEAGAYPNVGGHSGALVPDGGASPRHRHRPDGQPAQYTLITAEQ
jgi:MFS family permease